MKHFVTLPYLLSMYLTCSGRGFFAPSQLRPGSQLCLHCVDSILNPGEGRGVYDTHPWYKLYCPYRPQLLLHCDGLPLPLTPQCYTKLYTKVCIIIQFSKYLLLYVILWSSEKVWQICLVVNSLITQLLVKHSSIQLSWTGSLVKFRNKSKSLDQRHFI